MSWKRDPKTWLAIAVTLFLWASAFAGIRAGMRLTPAGLPGADGYGPGEVALLRFGTASFVLALYAHRSRACGFPTGVTSGASRSPASPASPSTTSRSTSAR